MKILRTTLRRFCNHENTSVEFSDGLNAITGPNGVGKSNLINGVVWALTGVDRNVGVKEDNVYLGSSSNEKAFVTVDLVHAGVEARVERSLRKGQTLSIGGAKWTKDAEIRAKLEEFLGVSTRMLLDYVFVEQLGMFSFISQDAEERGRAFGRLFGTEKAERIYKALGEVRVEAPSLPSAAVNEAAVRLQRTRQELEGLQVQLAALPLFETFDPNHEPETEALRLWEQAKRDRQEATDLARKIEEGRQVLAGPEAAAREKAAEVSVVEEHLASQAERERQAGQAVGDWGRRRAYLRNLNILREAEAAVAREPRPVPLESPEDYAPLSQAETEETAALTEERGRLLAFCRLFDQQGVAACPTCGTTTDRIAYKVPEARDRVAEIDQLLAQRRARSEVFRAYEKEAAAILARLAELRHRQRDLKAAGERLEIIAPPMMTEQEAAACLRDQKQCREGLRHLQAELASSCSTADRLRGALEQLERSHVDCLRRTAVQAISDAEAAVLQQSLRAKVEAATRRKELLIEVGILYKREKEDAEFLERRRAEEREAAAARLLAARLEGVRRVFHRDNLPRRVAEAHLRTMRDGINSMLSTFSAGFWVESIQDLQFMIRKPGLPRAEPAARLSVGQKGVFALAFRPVVNSMFARELGLLVLDEPAVGLDEANEACLTVALDRLRALCRSSGLQVVLVTHQRGLHAFDRVVDLAKIKET